MLKVGPHFFKLSRRSRFASSQIVSYNPQIGFYNPQNQDFRFLEPGIQVPITEVFSFENR